MPRGVYERKGSKRALIEKMMRQLEGQEEPSPREPEVAETEEEAAARIQERFDVLEMLVDAAVTGDARAVICSGPAGLGKSHSVEKKLAQWDPDERRHVIVKGFVRATGLYKQLWQHRHSGSVIVFDDADPFYDEVALNLLKAVCDTTDRRRVSWMSEGTLLDESSESIPKTFDFNGSIVFLTNLDFDSMIDRVHKHAPHLEALMSRAHYVDLTMRSRRDYLIRIKQVVRQGLLRERGLSEEQQEEVLQFVLDNQSRLRELSLRVAIKIAGVRRTAGPDWRRVARVTCCK